MLRRHALLCLVGLSIGTTLTAQGAGARTADTVLWTFAATQDVTFMRLTPFGTVVVGMPDRVVALDPATGQPIWTREDVKNLSAGAFDIIPLTPYGVVRSRNSVAEWGQRDDVEGSGAQVLDILAPEPSTSSR